MSAKLDEANIEILLKQFWENGYMVIRKGFTEELTNTILSIVEDQDQSKTLNFRSIFKTMGSRTFDAFRMQAFLKHIAFDDLKSHIKDFVSQYHMRWVPDGWVAFKSLSGGEEQDPHRDIPASEIAKARAKYPQTVQAGLIIGLMERTKLIVYPKCFAAADPLRRTELTIGAGDCVIFRGDLVHNEAPFTETNYRIHCMLKVEGIKWNDDATELALPPAFKCDYCDFMAPTKLKVRNHRKRCMCNPSYEAKRARERELNAQEKDCAVCGKHFVTGNAYRQHVSRRHRVKKHKTE